MSRRVYPHMLKATAISEMIAGSSYLAVAKKYHLPKGTVWEWWQKWLADQGAGREQPAAVSGEIHEVVARWVGEGVHTLVELTRLLGDRDYLQRHPPADLLAVYDAVSDRMMRVIDRFEVQSLPALSAVEPAGDEFPTESGPPSQD